MNTTPDSQTTSITDSDATTEQLAALRSEVDALRHDVERKDRHLQAVIDQYEAVLTETTWEYERRLAELESRQDACDCPVHRLAGWLADLPPVP